MGYCRLKDLHWLDSCFSVEHREVKSCYSHSCCDDHVSTPRGATQGSQQEEGDFEGQGSGLVGGRFKSLKQLASNPSQENHCLSLSTPWGILFVAISVRRVTCLADNYVFVCCAASKGRFSITEVKCERWNKMKLLISVRKLGHHSSEKKTKKKTGGERKIWKQRTENSSLRSLRPRRPSCGSPHVQDYGSNLQTETLNYM